LEKIIELVSPEHLSDMPSSLVEDTICLWLFTDSRERTDLRDDVNWDTEMEETLEIHQELGIEAGTEIMIDMM